MGQHQLPNDYPKEPAREGQRYLYAPGKCWVRATGISYQIELCDWSPMPDYGDDDPT